MNQQYVEYRDNPGYMTGKIVGASEDGLQLAVAWSDGITRVVKTGDVQDYVPEEIA